MVTVKQKLTDASTRSIQEGRFKLYNGVPPVYVGMYHWPLFVHDNILGKDADHELAVRMENDESGSRSDYEVAVTAKTAAALGFKVKEEVLEDIYKDGIPRYAICFGDKLRSLCDRHEHISEGAVLYLKSNPVSLLYYINSSVGSPELGIAHREANSKPQFPLEDLDISSVDEDDIYMFMKQPASCSTLKPTYAVEEGTEILTPYEVKNRVARVIDLDAQETTKESAEKGAGVRDMD